MPLYSAIAMNLSRIRKFGAGLCDRHDEYYLVKVCKGRSYEVIPALGDLGDDSSAELYPVAYCRTYTLCAENSPRLAFIYTVRGLYCVESP